MVDIGTRLNHARHDCMNDGIDIAYSDLTVTIDIARQRLGHRCIRMKVNTACHLGRSLTYPATILVDGIIDLDKIDMRQIDVTSLLINRPVNLEARIEALNAGLVSGMVGLVVNIAPREVVLNKIGVAVIATDITWRP